MRSRLLALAGFAGIASAAGAQTMRDFSVERGRKAETHLRAVVEFGGGELTLRPSTTNALYRLQLRYDTERFSPFGDYDAAHAVVRLGLERSGSGGIRVANRRQLAQTALVELSPNVGLTLEANLGASESSLELGGLDLEDLTVGIGASRAEVRFSRPTTGLCRRAEFSTGAAELTLKELGNSGCRRIAVRGGVGAVNADLAGTWPEDAEMTVSVTLGGVKLSAPRDLGVRLTVSRFLANLKADGFVKEGKTYTSRNYESAKRHINLTVESTLGGIEVEWR